MLKTNLLGAIIVVVFILALVGYGISIRMSLDWGTYFKIIGIVAFISFLVSAITHLIPSKD